MAIARFHDAMNGLSSDIRYAVRSLLKAPGFTVAVVGILALGIGANTAIFSIVDTVLLRPLPFIDAARLVAIRSLGGHADEGSCSYPDFADWKAQSTTLDRLGGYVTGSMAITGQALEATNLQTALVTPDLLPLLGAAPTLGRTFRAEDDRPGADRVAIISEMLWHQRFSRDSAIAGRSVTLDGHPFTIIGVMAARFQFPIQAERIDLWLPLAADPLVAQWREQRGARFMYAVGRLRSGATVEQAHSELATIAGRLAAAYPKSNSDRMARVMPFRSLLVRDFKLALIVLLSAVATVLLIACANVANLLLARGTVRQKEMAIRAALGAGRGRLARQLLTESLVLSMTGGAAGVVLALWGVAALVAASPVDIPRLHDVRIDRTVLLFATVVSLVTGLLFGLAPAFFLSRSNAVEALKDLGRGATGHRSARTRQILVVCEVALSLVLLASAGLLLRSLIALRHVNPGFIADRAVTADLSLPPTRYPDEAAQISFVRRLLDEMDRLPGVASSAIATTLPLSGNDMGIGFTVEGHPSADPKARLSATYFSVTPEYFKTMGIPIVKGRAFTNRDDEKAPFVAIVGETMARQYWPDENPIGKRLTLGINNTRPREIVGVVGDVKLSALSEPVRPEMYTPYAQTPWPFAAAVVRTKADSAGAGAGLRAAIQRVDSDQALGELKTFDQYVSRVMAEPRFNAMLVTSFAALALLLSGFGLYGVMSYSVAQRRREIGIRMALGAQPDTVRALIVSDALKIGAAGLLAGLAGAFAATRALQDLLFGVHANDPLTFAEVSLLLLGVLVAAAYLPARRATRVDPIIALRAE